MKPFSLLSMTNEILNLTKWTQNKNVQNIHVCCGYFGFACFAFNLDGRQN